jgi:nucleotide-binding universal stress UspA family protein
MSIICGTDLSAASAGALEVAVALSASSRDRDVVLVHVVDPEAGGGAAREAALEDARRRLDEVVARAARPDRPAIRAELLVGAPDEALAELAAAAGAELIVVAARSTQTSLLRLGTTAAKLTVRATVPVLAVRDPAPWLAFAARERPLRLLIGVDDSATCDLGIQWLRGLLDRGPAEVVLGAIYYPDVAAAHYGLDLRGMVEADPEIERLLTRDLLRRFGTTGRAQRVTARAHRGLGRIGDHVLELARAEQVDAIVVGTSQKTGLQRLGSVSSVIVHEAPQSVVCVPPSARIPSRGVPGVRAALVATDLSELANRAVPHAFAAVAAAADAEVHIVHVLDTDAATDADAAVIAQLAALAPIDGGPARLTPHVLRGADAATAIARCAARLGVDVICIASHGRSGISRALVGSVADRLLRATRCPVLVLRPAP